MTTQQFTVIDSKDFSVINSEAIAQLSTAQFYALSGAPGTFSSITSLQLDAMSTYGISLLTSTPFDTLHSTSIALLDASQVAALSSGVFTIMDSTQIGGISSTYWSSVTTQDVFAMVSTTIQGMTSAQISYLTTDAIQGLGSTQIQGFTSAQFLGFGTDDFATLTSAEIKNISSNQILGITSTQIAAMGAITYGGALTSAQLQTLLEPIIAGASTALALGSAAAVAARFTFATPMVLDLNGDGIQTVNINDGVNFDVNNDGYAERTAWVVNSDGLLVRDINGDGQINNGGELFGSGTILPNGTKAADGYVAMRALDTNMDGLLDANDQAFGELKIWKDANGNGKTDAGELVSLTDLGIKSLSLNANASTDVNNGNIIGLMGSYTTTDGKTHTMGDVWFQVDESGKQVFDLAAVAKAAGTSKVTLAEGQNQTLNVSLHDVLAVGAPDILSGTSQVTINGHAGDTVQLTGNEGWNLAGTTTDGAETYMVYVNQHAHLLVNDKIHTIIV